MTNTNLTPAQKAAHTRQANHLAQRERDEATRAAAHRRRTAEAKSLTRMGFEAISIGGYVEVYDLDALIAYVGRAKAAGIE